MGNDDVYWRHATTGAAGHILGDHILTHILFNIMRILVTGLLNVRTLISLLNAGMFYMYHNRTRQSNYMLFHYRISVRI